jgi:rod shape-determining protein MreC
VVLGVLLVAALALITFNYRDGSSGPLRGLQHVGGAVFGGAERAVSLVAAPVAGFFDRTTGSGDNSEVTALQQQVMRLRAQLSQEQLSKADYQQLSQLLQLSGRGGYRIVAATVIAVGEGYTQAVTLDAGTADGIKTGDTVINGQGLVGTVTGVSTHSCTVQLAIDATSVVGISLSPSGQLGYVTGPGKTGSGSGLMQLTVFDQNAALTLGEPLVTFASEDNRPYVAGVPVGVIAKVENRAGSLTTRALVRPYVDFTALSVVGIVVVPPSSNPRFSVLPPPPRPAPTVTVTGPARASASPSKPAGG